MVISIHQPNYLPWLGFFDKIKKSDVFVIMDDVQYPRGKNHFGHRNKIKNNNGTTWLTVPVEGKSDFKLFNEIGFKSSDWKLEHLRLLSVHYGKSPFIDRYLEPFKEVLLQDYSNLSDLNSSLIKYFLKELEINTEVTFSSQYSSNSGAERIFNILEKLNASSYISGTGPGSMRYIDEQEFKNRNINLIWQNYEHPEYTQQYGAFVPYMCILDLLFNVGPNGKDII